MPSKPRKKVEDEGEIIYQGWAWKVGNTVKTWKRRYFILKGSILTYGKDKKTVLKQIPVVSITQVIRKEIKCPKKQFEKFGLLLQLTGRNFKMVPESVDEQTAWFEALTPFKLFGGDLDEIMHHSSHESASVPVVVDQCVEALCKGELAARGLFRLSGNERRVVFLSKKYDCSKVKMVDNEWNLNIVEGEKNHVIASLLKKFLRKLERPLIPYAQYDELVELFQNFSMEEYAHEMMPRVKESLDKLSEASYVCLNVVGYMLHEVEQQNELMKSYNLGVVFGPVFMRQIKINMSEVMIMAQVVQFIIANYPSLMDIEAPYLDKYKNLVNTHGEFAEKRKEEQTQQFVTWLAESKDIPNIVGELTELMENDVISQDVYSRIYHAIYWHPKDGNPMSFKELYTIHKAKLLHIDLDGIEEYTDSEFLQSELVPTLSHDDLTEYHGEVESESDFVEEEVTQEIKQEATQGENEVVSLGEGEEIDEEEAGEYFDEMHDQEMVIDD